VGKLFAEMKTQKELKGPEKLTSKKGMGHLEGREMGEDPKGTNQERGGMEAFIYLKKKKILFQEILPVREKAWKSLE